MSKVLVLFILLSASHPAWAQVSTLPKRMPVIHDKAPVDTLPAKKDTITNKPAGPDAVSLEDRIIQGYVLQHKTADTAQLNTNTVRQYTRAQPATGWDRFNQYISANALSPDGKTGTVKLSFMVNADGSPANFRIIKSLSAACDAAAVQLIKGGPAWLCGADNKPENVTLHIKFTLKE